MSGNYSLFRVVCSLLCAGVIIFQFAGCGAPEHIDRSHAKRAYVTGDIDHADRILTRLVDEDNTDWEALYYLGLVRLKQGKPLEAQLLLEQAYSLRQELSGTQDILDALAESLYQQERFDNLSVMLDDATERYGTVNDYVRQGKYLGLSGDPDGAKLAFDKAAEFAGKDDPTPYVAAADFYESINNIPAAVENLRKAHAIVPHNLTIRDRLRKHGVIPGPTAEIQPKSGL